MVFTSQHKLLFSLAVVLGAILFRNNLELYYSNLKAFIIWNLETEESIGIYSPARLAQYNGIKGTSLYLAVLGTVYDVTKGRKYYGQGAQYHYFIGKDGSRALITGDFKDESKNKDHVTDLSCNELFTLLHWSNTFQQKYEIVGVLIGRYYDQSGKETAYSQEFNRKIEQCEFEKELAKKEELKYPPCNMAWSVDDGTKVWCTKSSGGVVRSWVGVPRQLYTPGEKKPRCVCINMVKEHPLGLLKEYENCPNTSVECTVDTSLGF